MGGQSATKDRGSTLLSVRVSRKSFTTENTLHSRRRRANEVGGRTRFITVRSPRPNALYPWLTMTYRTANMVARLCCDSYERRVQYFSTTRRWVYHLGGGYTHAEAIGRDFLRERRAARY